MHGRAKALLNQPRQLARPDRGVPLARFAEDRQNFFGKLVSLLGAAFVRNQASESVLPECRLRLIERWPRETKSGRGIGNRLALGLHAAKHLVLDLH